MENTNIAFLLMAALVSGMAAADQQPGAQPREEPASRQEMQMPKDPRLKVGKQALGNMPPTMQRDMQERIQADR